MQSRFSKWTKEERRKAVGLLALAIVSGICLGEILYWTIGIPLGTSTVHAGIVISALLIAFSFIMCWRSLWVEVKALWNKQ
jgi:hypothetical protein